MNILKISLFSALVVFTACGTESKPNENSTPVEVATSEVPISKQAADLTAASQKAMNAKKMDLVADAEEGMTIASAKDAKMANAELQVAATPPPATKRVSTATEKPTAVRVNKKTQVTQPLPAKPTTPVSKPVASVVEKTEEVIETATTVVTTPKPVVEKKEEKEEKEVEDKVDHAPFDALLRKHVSSSGKVNYKGFKADQSKLDAYLNTLSTNPIQSSWSRNEKMAYWINMYNAFTIKLIVDNYPVQSITKLEGGKPWDKKWIKSGDATYSLNQIENEILRPRYKEPAIHFAVNCAAKSCPPLLNRAWTADNLQSNFRKQAKNFINSSQYNKIGSDKIEVSKIFDWYKEDFSNLIDYLNKYSDTKISSSASINYLEYDWALNE